MGDYSFVARMPNESGALHRVAEIIKLHNGNINRISYDRRIDPQTVFFEISTQAASYQRIISELAEIGYLQTSLRFLRYLKVLSISRTGAELFLNFSPIPRLRGQILPISTLMIPAPFPSGLQ
jgi:hypothetical protein